MEKTPKTRLWLGPRRATIAIASLLCSIGAATDGLALPVQSQATEVKPRNVAILIFDGVQIIDFTAPFEVFGHVWASPQHPGYNVYTVARTSRPITTAMGMQVIPKYDISNAPHADVLVLPGGAVKTVTDDSRLLQWVRDATPGAQIVLSVCNGAFVLGRAGLLDGLDATTFALLIPELQRVAPKAHVLDSKRFADNGKIITSAGLSSGIDGALHVIERLDGRVVAQTVALVLEYDWDPEGHFVRAALADKYLRFPLDFDGEPTEKTGDRDHWRSSWVVSNGMSRRELFEHMNSILETMNPNTLGTIKWVRAERGDPSEIESKWRFQDQQGRPWEGRAKVEELAGQPGRLKVTLSVARSAAERISSN